MTKALDPYSRVYWRAIDDPKFVGIWDDDAALAAWTRLLVAADMAWPATASLYHGVKAKALDKLCQSGLVDLQPGHRYRIHGLDAERARRGKQPPPSGAATPPADDPDEPLPVPDGSPMGPRPVPNGTPSLRQEKSRGDKDEQSQDKEETSPNGVLPLRGVTGRANGSTLETPSEGVA